MKGVCVDDSDNAWLNEGVTYVIESETHFDSGAPAYTLKGYGSRRFRRDRFEIVQEIVGEYVFTSADFPRINEAPTPTVDTSDWRVWRDQNRPANNCACGIPRSQCTYHKENEQ